ncbi:MAG TPA: DUF2934 domain-containing protein [Acidobacteriaceae bacterium]|nr:DUF2934 domain-containing protein [Acidobacteriaceae bacterium]
MAETTEKAKKAKAPAKPRAAAGTKKAAKKTDGTAAVDGAAAGAKTTVYVPTHDEIAFLALQYWEQRGRAHGDHVRDWLRAEQDLMKMAS